MNTSATSDARKWRRSYTPTSARAVAVDCDDDLLVVTLEDGRVLHVPLAWFPALSAATPQQRSQCEIGGGGTSLHWEEIDEDLSVTNLLAGGDAASA